MPSQAEDSQSMKHLGVDRVLRSRRKTVTLQIDEKGKLILRAPLHASERSLRELLERKRSWIERHQRVARERYRVVSARGFGEGERYPYLGSWYPLEYIPSPDGKGPCRFSGRSFQIDSNRADEVRELMMNWYREAAARVLPERVSLYADRSGLSCSGVRISHARKRWASCSPSGVLNFSWRIVMAPMEVIDYLVVHELCHRAEQNHSSRFWDRVSSILPDYAHRRKWLREQGFLLTL
jgi:predicted metal-dependent hydrolase